MARCLLLFSLTYSVALAAVKYFVKQEIRVSIGRKIESGRPSIRISETVKRVKKII
jgi:hypothetical protein